MLPLSVGLGVLKTRAITCNKTIKSMIVPQDHVIVPAHLAYEGEAALVIQSLLKIKLVDSIRNS